MLSKEMLSLAAIILTFVAFIPYIRSIFNQQTKPHVFSWLIWSITTFIVFVAQLDDGAGIGAWPTGVSACVTSFVAYLAYLKKADISISKMDSLFFVAAITSLILWYFTSSPLSAVVVLTLIDTLGFAPTFRKVYYQPYQEERSFYALIALRNIVAITALENFSATTVLFPAVIAFSCSLLLVLITYRRHLLSP
ncbi:MAG: hypothetical protein KBT50_03100 [Cycloclasticus sp.]|nr:hypothetical protein [Cycloclasticus sp.]MBQ0789580.1 hypothetical protein [Cycloclasticus sp.]